MDSFALGNALMAGAQGTGQLAQGMFKDQIAAANRAQQAGLQHAKMQAEQTALQQKNTADQARADAANKTRLQAANIEASSRAATTSTNAQSRLSAAKISADSRVQAAAARQAAKANSPTAANKQVQQQISDAKSSMYSAQKQLDSINAALGKATPDSTNYKQLQANAADQQQLVNALKAKLSTLGDRNFPAATPTDFPGATQIPPAAASTPGSSPQLGAAAPQAPAPAAQPQQPSKPAQPSAQTAGPAMQGNGTTAAPFTPQNAADYAKIPPGQLYVKDGQIYRKN